MYLCGEVEHSDQTRVIVPIVCSQNWEELIRCSPDDGVAVRLEVKKAAMIKSNPLGMLIIDYFYRRITIYGKTFVVFADFCSTANVFQ